MANNGNNDYNWVTKTTVALLSRMPLKSRIVRPLDLLSSIECVCVPCVESSSVLLLWWCCCCCCSCNFFFRNFSVLMVIWARGFVHLTHTMPFSIMHKCATLRAYQHVWCIFQFNIFSFQIRDHFWFRWLFLCEWLRRMTAMPFCDIYIHFRIYVPCIYDGMYHVWYCFVLCSFFLLFFSLYLSLSM